MTDLPADPSAWDLDPDRPADGRVRDATSRPGTVADAGPPLPVRILGEDAAGADTGAAATAAGEDAVGPLGSPSVTYQPLTALAPRSTKALVGPFVGVALLALGIGFLLARTAGSGGASTSRTIVTPPPNTAAVLGTSVKPTTTVGAGATSTAAAATTTTASSAASTATSAVAAPTTTTTAAGASSTVAPVTAGSPTSAPAAVSSSADAVASPVRWAEFRGGRVYLHGRVPSAAVAATIVRKVSAVVGDGNVDQDYTIDPATPAVSGGPLTVAETVQFDMDSAVVRPEFGRILDLGVILMAQNPAVRITVVGRSDNRGPARYNLELSQRRAAAVVAYLTGKGADAARITIDARGADDPLAAGDSAADLQANRSVEFVITGLLD